MGGIGRSRQEARVAPTRASASAATAPPHDGQHTARVVTGRRTVADPAAAATHATARAATSATTGGLAIRPV